MSNLRHLAVLGLLSIAATACENPARDKPKAEVTAPASAAPATGGSADKGTVVHTFDEKSSKLAWTGSKVTGKHVGVFEKFKGTISLVERDPSKSKVTVEIDTTSVTSDTAKLTGHLKSADFFDVEKHPKASFESTKIVAGGEGGTHTITGNLDLHGVKKSISFPATIKVEDSTVSVKAEFSINRKDFGIDYAGKADDLIRDEVLLELDIQAPAQKA